MKDKIEEILNNNKVLVYKWDKLVKQISNLIQQERKDAINSFADWCGERYEEIEKGCQESARHVMTEFSQMREDVKQYLEESEEE